MLKMKNETYDFLKNVVMMVLPALITLWLGVGMIWNIPYTVEIGDTAALITTFLGVLLKVAAGRYYDELKDEFVSDTL